MHDSPPEPKLDAGWTGAMGMRPLQVDATRVVLEWTVGPEHLQPFGLVHGGVFSGAVETACSIGASKAASGQAVVGVENHTSFLRPVTAGRLRVTAQPIHVGKTTQLWEAHVVDESERLVASGRLRVMIVPQRSP